MSLFEYTSGPPDAEIVLVGEAWGAEEETAKQPFVGSAGNELSRILAEAKLERSSILLANVIPSRPQNNEMWRFFDEPKGATRTVRHLHPTERLSNSLARLYDQIRAFPRKLILAAGNYPLWALTDCSGHTKLNGETGGRHVPTGITNWRGSMWYGLDEIGKPQLLPIYHPSAIMRNWATRAITVHDLKARVPMALRGDWRPSTEPTFWAPPTFEQATSKLGEWLSRADGGERIRIAADIETIPSRKLLVCLGLADSTTFAMCIPFLDIKGGVTLDYWEHNQEVALITLLRRLLSHSNILLEGQNFNYDNQFLYRDWAIIPLVDFDTMSAQHLMWPGTPKGLDYISSLYCDYHWYWKEDGKEWDIKGDLKRQLLYNCQDCVRTFEAAETMRAVIKQLNLEAQWEETKERHWLALRMMIKGVRVDKDRRRDVGIKLREAVFNLYSELDKIIPKWMLPEPKKGSKLSAWYKSPMQQKWVFENIFGIKLPINRKTGQPTLDKNALLDLGRKYPMWRGIFKRLSSLRSAEVFLSHFIDAPLNPAGRMCCFFKSDGTETFRWSSSQTAFKEGANLQTIPEGDDE
jgi:uracil-DNA glycosylase